MDTEGVISLPEDITAGNYIVRYSICQKDVPANCSEANIILSVIGISIDAAKTID